MIITFDADFHALLKVGGYRAPSVIWFRVEGLKAETLSEIIQHALSAVVEDVALGALVTVNAKTIRIHRLS